MDYSDRIAEALSALQPWSAMDVLVHEMSSAGLKKGEIYQILSDYWAQIQEEGMGREREQRVLEDTLDALTGYCHPDDRLLPDEKL